MPRDFGLAGDLVDSIVSLVFALTDDVHIALNRRPETPKFSAPWRDMPFSTEAYIRDWRAFPVPTNHHNP